MRARVAEDFEEVGEVIEEFLIGHFFRSLVGCACS